MRKQLCVYKVNLLIYLSLSQPYCLCPPSVCSCSQRTPPDEGLGGPDMGNYYFFFNCEEVEVSCNIVLKKK